MDTPNLLKTVAQPRNGIMKKNLKLLRVKSPQSTHKPFEGIPRSMTQLLSKYSPRNSPKASTEAVKQNMMCKLRAITRILQKITRKALVEWRNYIQTSNNPRNEPKYRFNLPANLRTKLIKPQANRYAVLCLSPLMQVHKCKEQSSTRSSTIKKLESVVQIVKSLRKVNLRLSHQVFLDISSYKIHRDFMNKVQNHILSKKLQSYFITLLNFSKTMRRLSLHTNQCISITPKPKTPGNLSVIQETAFNLVPVRNRFTPLTLNYRYSNNELLDSQLLTFDLSPNNSFALPAASHLKSLESQIFENNPLDDSQKNILLEYSGRESLEDFRITERMDSSLVELEDKYNASSREMSPILRGDERRGESLQQGKIIKGIASTSTMCIAKAQTLRRKADAVFSREETIYEIPVCEKSDSVNVSKEYRPLRIEVGSGGKRIIERCRTQKIVNEKNNRSQKKAKLIVKRSTAIERRGRDTKGLWSIAESVVKRIVFRRIRDDGRWRRFIRTLGCYAKRMMQSYFVGVISQSRAIYDKNFEKCNVTYENNLKLKVFRENSDFSIKRLIFYNWNMLANRKSQSFQHSNAIFRPKSMTSKNSII